MRYRLFEKIGSGGMAEVFRAVGEGPEGFERPFVVKQIHPRLSEAAEFVRMFVDEAKISARLLHPNVVQVFEFVYQDGCYYMVMEPVDGVDMARLLHHLIDRREVPPPALVAEIARQACRGLDYAHTLSDGEGKPLGIVHRDVTPPNVMVSWNGTVKLLDFGLARAVEQLRTTVTETGTIKGKMPYLAPELLKGRTADARCDVFSLGVVMHELLTGARLFAGGNDLETFKNVLERPVPPPTERNPGIKPVLSAIVMRALERDPDKRYQTAREMGDELEAFVLRERYSGRLVAKKLHEMLGNHASSGALDPVADTPHGFVVDPPIVIGDGSSTVGREPTPAKVAARTAVNVGAAPSATPPPPPAALAAAAKANTSPGAKALPPPVVAGPVHPGGGAPRPSGSPPQDSRSARAAQPWRSYRSWLALGTPLALAGGLLLLVAARRPLTVSASTTATLPVTVALSLDSVPQGALVSDTDGKPLGETPLVLDLSRARSPVELVLSKPGFVATRFKVIPNHDKHAVATLELAEEPVQPAAAAAAAASTSAPPPTRGASHAPAAGPHPPAVKRHPRRAAGAPRALPKAKLSQEATGTLPSVRSRKGYPAGESNGNHAIFPSTLIHR